MKLSIKKGIGFGLTSGIITTLGLMVGLNSGTHSSRIVIGGILVIAIADALSDALGMHISEESGNKHTVKEIWEATICTFLAKFVFAIIFIIPVLLFPLNQAVVISVIGGLLLITGFSYIIGREQKIKAYKVVLEHLIITILVIVATYYIGELAGKMF